MPTRTAFADPGPALGRSPASTLLRGPPTPLFHRRPLRFPSTVACHGAGACSLPAARAPTGARRAGALPRRRSQTGLSRGDFGASQVTGSSSCVRAPVKHPAGRADASPLASRRRPCCLRWLKGPSAPECQPFRGRYPAARTLAHLRITGPCRHGRRKARYRPAGLSFGRAGFAPAGRHTEFRKGTPSFLPNGPALPGRILQRAPRHLRRQHLRLSGRCARW